MLEIKKELDGIDEDVAFLNDIKKQLVFKENKDKITQAITRMKIGLRGEENVLYHLKHSGVEMQVLCNLYIEIGEYNAQIDFLVITQSNVYQIECKNYSGKMRVTQDGEFRILKEEGGEDGLKSPLNQAYIHNMVIHKLIAKSNLIDMTEFDDRFKYLVVYANEYSTINLQEASKEVKEKVLRIDELLHYFKKGENSSRIDMDSISDYFLRNNKQSPKNYLQQYTNLIEEEKAELEDIKTQQIKCEICGNNIYINPITKEVEKNEYQSPCCKRCGGLMEIEESDMGMIYRCTNKMSCKNTVKIR